MSPVVFCSRLLFLLSCYTAGRKAEAGKHFPSSLPQTGFWKHLRPNIWLSASPISVCWRLYSLASSHPSEDEKIKVLAHIFGPDPISCQRSNSKFITDVFHQEVFANWQSKNHCQRETLFWIISIWIRIFNQEKHLTFVLLVIDWVVKTGHYVPGWMR